MFSRPLLLVALAATLAVLACAASAVAAPPPNDAFSAALTLGPTQTTGAVAAQQTLDGATVEAGEDPAAPGTQTVWYRFVPSYTGLAYVDACSADFRPRLSTYEGTALGSLSFLGSNAPSSCADYAHGESAVIPVTAGKEVRIRVFAYEAALSGTHFALLVNTPHNDDLLAADPMTQNFGNFAELMGATKQIGEPNHAGDAGGHSVWFKWTSGAAGPAKFTSCWWLTGFDTLLAAYQDGNAFPLGAVASNDDDATCKVNPHASTVTFNAAAHTTYRIALDGYHTQTPSQLAAGAFLLFPPKDDQLADAFPISGSMQTGAWGYTATKEQGEPDHAGVPGGASTWWAWTATASGPTTFDTCAQWQDAPDTVLAVYTGDAYPLTPVASNDDTAKCGLGTSSLVTFDAVAGTTYKIAQDVKSGAGDALLLNAAVPDNDFFAHPSALSGSGSADADLSTASAEPGEPTHAGAAAAASRWWTYTAPADGTVHVDTCATQYVDTTLEVYAGDALGALQSVAASDDAPGCGYRGSSVDFAATAGTTYRIAVDAKDGFGGPATLTYGGPGAPAPAPAPAPGGDGQAGGSHTGGALLGKVHIGRARLGRLARGRFTVTASCLRACAVTATVRSHGHPVAMGVGSAGAARDVKLRLRVPARKRAALRQLRSMRARLVITAIDPTTHLAARVVRTVRFRR